MTKKLLILLFVILLSTSIYATPIEDPSPSSFQVSKGSTDLYTGDFSESIPIFTIPGINNMNFPLSLSYSSGIKINQEASFVGLGWDFNPGVITRSVNGIPDDQNSQELGFMYDNAANATDAYGQDNYYVSFSDIGGKLYFYKPDNSLDNELVKPILSNYKPIKIYPTLTPTDGISEWIIIDTQGTQYIFDHQVKIQNTINTRKYYFKEDIDTLTPDISPSGETVIEDCGIPLAGMYKTENCWPFFYDGSDYTKLSQFNNSVSLLSSETKPQYTYAWYLTKILSNDYVDDGDGIVNYYDKGSWIVIDYTSPQTINFKGLESVSKMPNSTFNISRMFDMLSNCAYPGDPECSEWFNGEEKRDEITVNTWIYSSVDPEVEYSYINKIRTSTHTAKFYYSARQDILDENDIAKTKKLDRIELMNFQESETYKKVIFNYDYSLAKPDDTSNGKLTLKSITIEGKNSAQFPPYQFEYESPDLKWDSYAHDQWSCYNGQYYDGVTGNNGPGCKGTPTSCFDLGTNWDQCLAQENCGLGASECATLFSGCNTPTCEEKYWPDDCTSQPTCEWVGDPTAYPFEGYCKSIDPICDVYTDRDSCINSPEYPICSWFDDLVCQGPDTTICQENIGPPPCEDYFNVKAPFNVIKKFDPPNTWVSGCYNEETQEGLLGCYWEDDYSTIGDYAATWSLNKITSPLGGTKEIEYESDTYSYVQDNPIPQKSGGGTRVKSITNDNGLGDLSTTTYDYLDGVASAEPTIQEGDVFAFTDLAPQQSVYVAYSQVTENLPGDYGKVITSFYTLRDNPDECIDSKNKPHCFYDWKRGQIKDKKSYSNTNALMQQTDYDYQFKHIEDRDFTNNPCQGPPIICRDYDFYNETCNSIEGCSYEEGEYPFRCLGEAVQCKEIWNETSCSNQIFCSYKGDKLISSGIPLVTSKTTTLDSISSTIEYKYNDFNNLANETIILGPETNKITTTRYAFEDNSNIKNKNMISQTAFFNTYDDINQDKQIDANDVLKRHSGITWDEFSTNNFYPSSIFVWYDSNFDNQLDQSEVITTKTYDDYDDGGNLLQSTNIKGLQENWAWHFPNKQLDRYWNNVLGSTYVNKYDYNEINQLTTEEGANNNIITTSYNDLWTIESITNPLDSSPIKTFTYNYVGDSIAQGNENTISSTTQINPSLTKTEIKFIDGFNKPVSNKLNNGANPTYVDVEYNELSRINKQYLPYTSTKDKRTELTYYKDPLSRIKNIKPPGSTSPEMFYTYTNDSTNRIIAMTDAFGRNMFTYFDSLGRKVKKIDDDGNEWQYKYNILGQLIEIIDPKLRSTTIEYDSLGNIIRQKHPDVGIQDYLYNKFTLDLVSTTKNNYIRNPGFEATGSTSTSNDVPFWNYISGTWQEPEDTTCTNPKNGDYCIALLGSSARINQIIEVDPSTSYKFSIYTTTNSGSTKDIFIEVYGLDGSPISFGSHTSGTNWDWERGSLGFNSGSNSQVEIRLTSATGATNLYVDTIQVERNQRGAPFDYNEIIYKNDQLGRITIIETIEESTTYRYDLYTTEEIPPGLDNYRGKLTEIENSNSLIRYFYNKKDQIEQSDIIIDGIIYTTTYSYDMAGHVVTLTNPIGGVITYIYNNLNELDKIYFNGDLITDYEYTPETLIDTITFGNNVFADFDYEQHNLLDSLSYSYESNSILEESYVYDTEGKIKNLYEDLTKTNKVADYNYDNLDRLSTVVSYNNYYPVNYNYSYSRLGDINSITQEKGSFNYQYYDNDLDFNFPSQADSSETSLLATDGIKYYTYNQEFNLNRIYPDYDSILNNDINYQQFEYNYLNLPTKITLPNGNNITYIYDALGNRIKKITFETETLYFYDLSGNVIYRETNLL